MRQHNKRKKKNRNLWRTKSIWKIYNKKNSKLISEKTVGSINIAASQTIANYWLPRRLALFHARNPEVSLHLTMSNTRAVENAVVKGKADIGFVEGQVSSDKLELMEVDHDQIALVA